MSIDHGDAKASIESVPPFEESRAKFAADGSPLRFPGATVVCHLRENGSQNAIFRAIEKNCFDIAEGALNEYVQLPKDSLHMTLLDVRVYHETYNPSNRGKEEDRVTDLSKFRQAFCALQDELRKTIPIKMMIDLNPARRPKAGNTLGVPVKPCNEEEGDKLRAIRAMLSSAFDMTPLDPAYGFHISGYYPLQSLSDKRFLEIQNLWSKSVNQVSEAVPTFEIDSVELCAFENMFHFEVKESVSLWS